MYGRIAVPTSPSLHAHALAQFESAFGTPHPQHHTRWRVARPDSPNDELHLSLDGLNEQTYVRLFDAKDRSEVMSSYQITCEADVLLVIEMIQRRLKC